MENKPAYSVVLSSAAEKQLLESFDWYELQSRFLGDRFVEAVMDRIGKIQQNPELFSITYKSFREVKVTTFPFVIVYELSEKEKLSTYYLSFIPHKAH